MRIARAEQLDLSIDEPEATEAELEAEADEQRILFLHLMAACRAVNRELTADTVAQRLDDIWAHEKIGHGVSSSVLRASLNANGGERNYFRIEWIIEYARRSPLVSEILLEIVGRGVAQKPLDEELHDLKELVRAEYPRQAERLLRKAAAPRARKR